MDLRTALKWVGVTALALMALYVVTAVYASGQALIALALLLAVCFTFFVFVSPRLYSYRYVYPGLMAVLIFIVLPIGYTGWVAFTNYSSSHILTLERAQHYLLSDTYRASDASYAFDLYGEGPAYHVVLHDAGGAYYTTPLVDLSSDTARTVAARAVDGPPADLGEKATLRAVIRHRDALGTLSVTLPGGRTASMTSLREFAPVEPRYRLNDDGTLTNRKTGETLTPNFDTGFYETADGRRVTPGFRVTVGWDNYEHIFADPAFREPFLRIFLWTVIFAGLTVVFATAVGMTLAVLLSWEALRFRAVYRMLLFLPYAVPGFISILVFRGLFNENFGEINFILHALFGIKPNWFSDPTLARAMILIVNTWLGYPYVMVLCMGMLKSIPQDIYEASALAGVGAVKNFFRITLPLIIRPLTPLLIAAFAFNFNNFVLIELLTAGRPDFLGTRLPAGTTDILVTYTYRIAFEDSGKNFALAAAISTVIFLLVAMLAIVNLRLTRASQEPGRA